MATAILRSQDCLRDRFQKHPMAPLPLRSRSASNQNPNSKPTNASSSLASNLSAKSPLSRSRKRKPDAVVKSAAKNLVMGQVTILKRGEKLAPPPRVAEVDLTEPAAEGATAAEDLDLALSSTERLGPEPEAMQKHIRASDLSMYAGSAFVASPPPSSLPFPAFTKKAAKVDAATSDLRRLLRLDLDVLVK